MKKYIFKFFSGLAIIISMAGNANAQYTDPTAAAHWITTQADTLRQWATQNAANAAMTSQQQVEHVETDATIMSTGAKSDASNKIVAESTAQWKEQQEERREQIRMSHSLEQPSTTCATLSAIDAQNATSVDAARMAHYGAAAHVSTGRTIQPSVPGAKGLTAPPIQDVVNSQGQIVSTYDYVMSNFCTSAESASGRCQGTNVSAEKYPGGDMRADLLFGDGSGAGGAGNGSLNISDDQNKAVEAFINNIVDSMPPEMLRDPNWEKTPGGRKYVLMVRQYAAMMSMPATALRTTQANHTIDPAWGTSKMDQAEQYVKLKWSKDAIADMATATDQNKLLRDIDQNSAFGNWVLVQIWKEVEQSKGISATALSNQLRSTMLPEIEKQRTLISQKGGAQ